MILEIFHIFVDNIAPILIIAALGFLLGKLLELDPRPVGRIIFYILSPALVFQSISTSQITGAELVQIILGVVLFVAFMTGIAYLLLAWLGVERLERSSVMLAVITANNGNFGLPVIELAFGPEVFARAVVVFVTITISNYSTGVFIASSGRKTAREALSNILRVPSVYAAAIGLTINFTGTTLPPFLAGPIERVSLAAVPMMLILLGLQLSNMSSIAAPRLVSIGVMLRLLLSPLAALGIATIIGLNQPAMIAFIMQTSMPVAVMTIILATEYNLNRSLSLSLVLASTAVSPITLSVLILVLTRLPSL